MIQETPPGELLFEVMTPLGFRVRVTRQAQDHLAMLTAPHGVIKLLLELAR